MILRRQQRSLFITTVTLTYFAFCSAFSKEQDSIENLKCTIGKPQMLELRLWAKDKAQLELESGDYEKVFEIRGLHTRQPELFDPKFKTARALKVIRRTNNVELFNFQSYNYTENFEYHIKSGKIEYTQIFRDVGSNAQFYVATGRCEVIQP